MKPAAIGIAVAGAVIALSLACRVGGVPQGPAALIFGATALAGTAVYREVTGGCWAACNAGWVCNPESGRCEPIARERQRRLLRREGSAEPANDSRAPAGDAGADAAVDAAAPGGARW